MINVQDHGKKFEYTVCHKPVFRGVNPKTQFDKKDYEIGGFGQWTCFERCTKNRKLANKFSRES